MMNLNLRHSLTLYFGFWDIKEQECMPTQSPGCTSSPSGSLDRAQGCTETWGVCVLIQANTAAQPLQKTAWNLGAIGFKIQFSCGQSDSQLCSLWPFSAVSPCSHLLCFRWQTQELPESECRNCLPHVHISSCFQILYKLNKILVIFASCAAQIKWFIYHFCSC